MKLCERFGCLPSQLYAEDALLLRLVHIADLGKPDPAPDDDDYDLGGLDGLYPL